MKDWINMRLFRYILTINIAVFAAVTCQAATVGDFVWEDANKNGIQDGGESGVSGVTIRLLISLRG